MEIVVLLAAAGLALAFVWARRAIEEYDDDIFHR